MTPENLRTYYSMDIYSGFEFCSFSYKLNQRGGLRSHHSVCFSYKNNETPVFLEPIIQYNKNKKKLDKVSRTKNNAAGLRLLIRSAISIPFRFIEL